MTVTISPSSQELAEYQRGVIARWQFTARPDLIAADALVRRGRWRALYRGVYACYTGRAPRTSALWAAVLRCGPDAVLSHHSAAELDRLADQPVNAIYVTIPARQRIRIAASELAGGLPPIVLHRSLRLGAARHPARRPPRTRLEETVLDLVDTAATFDEAFGWLTTACGRRLTTPWQLSVAAQARARLRWRADLRGALEDVEDGVMSGLESKFVCNVERRHGLPVPQRQAKHRPGDISAYLDNYYPGQLLAVELDGLAAHPAETRWSDIHRDNRFASRGIVTLRYNWADITVRSCLVAAEIAAVLQLRGWTGHLRRCPRCPAARAARPSPVPVRTGR